MSVPGYEVSGALEPRLSRRRGRRRPLRTGERVRKTITCRDFVDFLADYLAGELKPDLRAAFDDHLARCPGCVSYMNSYRDTGEAARLAYADPEALLPEDVPEDLVLAVLAARAQAGDEQT